MKTLRNTSFKHSIKRVDRFLANDNVVVSDWCKALTDTVIGPRQAVKIAIDWTKIGPWPVLVASVVIKRRGIPIYWATCDYKRLKRSQNAFEESFLVMLRGMIPHDVDVILLFDRGFRRVSLVRHLKILGFHFVIRSCADTHIMTLSNEKIALRKLHLPCGVIRDLDLPAIEIIRLYGRRFTIEEFFRDSKDSPKNSFALSARLERLQSCTLAARFLVCSI